MPNSAPDSELAFERAERFRVGKGVRQSWDQALHAYEVAAEAGNIGAAVWLGRIYGGLEEPEPIPEQAVKWLMLAAESGDTPSMCDLGLHTFNGWGIAEDITKAAALYSEAAKLGDTWAAYLLGLCYSEGEGVEKDKQRALHWLDKASDDHREARDMAYFIRWGGD